MGVTCFSMNKRSGFSASRQLKRVFSCAPRSSPSQLSPMRNQGLDKTGRSGTCDLWSKDCAGKTCFWSSFQCVLAVIKVTISVLLNLMLLYKIK